MIAIAPTRVPTIDCFPYRQKRPIQIRCAEDGVRPCGRFSQTQKPKDPLLVRSRLGCSGGGHLAYCFLRMARKPFVESAKIVCAQGGSIAAGGNAAGNIINFNRAAVPAAAGSQVLCSDTAKPR
jgi:hypothetical protein